MKGFIAVTSFQWIDYLRVNNHEGEVNFWRSNTSTFKAIDKGEPFFFLKKNNQSESGERQVVGFGLFERFEVNSITDSWNKYSTMNGLSSLAEFKQIFEKMYNKEDASYETGSIILSNVRIFDKPLYLSDINISFANSIVSGKTINNDEVSRIFNQLEITEENILSSIEEVKIGISSDEEAFPEGKKYLKMHLIRERNPRVIQEAKKRFIRENDNVYCEVCGFDFEEKYGEVGKDFIEGHHVIPVSQLKNDSKTNISDIILVCSNCHSMIHRRRPWLNKSQLSNLLKK